MVATSEPTLLVNDAESDLVFNYVAAEENGDRETMNKIISAVRDLAAKGIVSADRFATAVRTLKESNRGKQRQGDRVEPQVPRNEQPKETQQQEVNKSMQTTQPAQQHGKDKLLVGAFRVARGVALVTNVVPYRVIVSTLLPQTAIAELWGVVAGMPIVGVAAKTALACVLWYLLQRLETWQGRDSWWVRGMAYAVDAGLCFVTFPPIVGGINALGLFWQAGLLSDIDWGNLATFAFAVGIWELLDAVERVIFPGCRFGFWGVK